MAFKNSGLTLRSKVIIVSPTDISPGQTSYCLGSRAEGGGQGEDFCCQEAPGKEWQVLFGVENVLKGQNGLGRLFLMSRAAWVRRAPGNEGVYELGHFRLGKDRDSQTSS